MIYDLIIIGGGASGLVMANLAKQKGLNFIVLEMNKAAKKIRVTGNGKCNLTNLDMGGDYYNDDFVKDVIATYPPQRIMGFFEKMGMKTKAVETRVYPYNESSQTAAWFLTKDILNDLRENYKVEDIKKKGAVFYINNNLKAKNVFFATGGDATMGCDSLHLLKKFGHSVKPFNQALTWLKTKPDYIKGLNGIRAKACVSLYKERGKVARQSGEVLFKKEGISGIAIFMLSSYIARKAGKYELKIDFAGDMTTDEIKNYNLEGVVRKEIARNIKRQAKDRNISPIEVIKDFQLEVISLGDKKHSQVLSGGIDLKDIDPNSMQSKLVKGLYIGGECMDIDGQCGGYNLHWAFASAMAAFDYFKTTL